MKHHKFSKDIKSEWHGSKAEEFLKEDVREGNYIGKKPKELRLTRDKCKVFDLTAF